MQNNKFLKPLSLATLATVTCIASIAYWQVDRWLPLLQGNNVIAQSDSGDDQDHAGHDHSNDAPHLEEDVHSEPESDHSGHDHASESSSHDAHDHASDAPCPSDSEFDDCDVFDHLHDEASTLRLSKQAEANIGLGLHEVKLQPFARTITVPATITERPGQSQLQVTATFSGLVSEVYPIQGQVVEPDMPLFRLQLTDDALIDAQANFLQTAKELEVVQREVARIAAVAAQGAIAGKSLLERQYEQQKLEAVHDAQRQRLILQRLTPEEVDEIGKTGELLREQVVMTPSLAPQENGRLLQVETISVTKGQYVRVGDPLCVLADHSRLYIEGRAFEQDIPAISAAAANGWKLSMVVDGHGSGRTEVTDLSVLYLDNKVDRSARVFRFYVTLPNTLSQGSDAGQGNQRRFIDWQFKPGQQVRLRVPIDESVLRIVLPAEAVVRDGAEFYVFEYNDGHFDRRNVHVEYRDQDYAVIANDGILKLGVQVAGSGSYQIHLATKSKDGPVVDPHAGHNH